VEEGEMTPKEQYEARKAARRNLVDMDYQLKKRTEEGMMLDTFDRFVTAVERIADALEKSKTAPPRVPV
jgi:hypothetical protein